MAHASPPVASPPIDSARGRPANPARSFDFARGRPANPARSFDSARGRPANPARSFDSARGRPANPARIPIRVFADWYQQSFPRSVKPVTLSFLI